MPYRQYSPHEVAARGEELYQREIRPRVEAENHGRFLVLDIETGEYEIDADDRNAMKRARAKRADAVLYGVRIGFPTAHWFGGQCVPERR